MIVKRPRAPFQKPIKINLIIKLKKKSFSLRFVIVTPLCGCHRLANVIHIARNCITLSVKKLPTTLKSTTSSLDSFSKSTCHAVSSPPVIYNAASPSSISQLSPSKPSSKRSILFQKCATRNRHFNLAIFLNIYLICYIL